MKLKPLNQKEFLCKDSIYSTSAIHTKLYEDGRAMIRMSDCNGSIRLWNNFVDNANGQAEIFEKIDTLIEHLKTFKQQLKTIQESEIEQRNYQLQSLS